MLAPASGSHAEQEAAAVAAIDALKSAAVIKSKKADWRLVAAAQAMRRGDFNDEFDAATAMGKKIGQRREVANWVDKLEQLAQLAAPTSGDATARPLLVDSAWVAQHAPAIQQLNAGPLVLSADEQHGKRTLSAVSLTPNGSMREASAAVDYTLPPAGERESVSKRRDDRHRRREERKIRSLDLTGTSQQQHATAHAARLRAARENEREIAVFLEELLEEVCLQDVAHKLLQLPMDGDECWQRSGTRFPGEAVWMDPLAFDPADTARDRLVRVDRIFANMKCDVTVLDMEVLDFCEQRLERVPYVKLRPLRPCPGFFCWGYVPGPTPWSRPTPTEEELRVDALLSANAALSTRIDALRAGNVCERTRRERGGCARNRFYVGPCDCGTWPPTPVKLLQYRLYVEGGPAYAGMHCRDHPGCHLRICHRQSAERQLELRKKLQDLRDERGCECPVDRPCICWRTEAEWDQLSRNEHTTNMYLNADSRFWPRATFPNWKLPLAGHLYRKDAPWERPDPLVLAPTGNEGGTGMRELPRPSEGWSGETS